MYAARTVFDPDMYVRSIHMPHKSIIRVMKTRLETRAMKLEDDSEALCFVDNREGANVERYCSTLWEGLDEVLPKSY